MIYPMKSQSEFNDTLNCFYKEIEVPVFLVMDGHMAQKNNTKKKFCHNVVTTLLILGVETRGPITLKYTSVSSNNMSTGTHL